MNPVQYIIANEGAGMSPGKLAAQVAHGSVEGLLLSYRRDEREPGVMIEPNIVRLWRCGGHYAKVVLGVSDEDALRTARDYIRERGFQCASIIDEGRTEIEPMTFTALGVEVVDKDNPHVQKTFGEFKLYSDPSKPKVFIFEGKLTPQQYEAAKVSGDPEAYLRRLQGTDHLDNARASLERLDDIDFGLNAEPWWRRWGRWLYDPTPTSDM